MANGPCFDCTIHVSSITSPCPAPEHCGGSFLSGSGLVQGLPGATNLYREIYSRINSRGLLKEFTAGILVNMGDEPRLAALGTGRVHDHLLPVHVAGVVDDEARVAEVVGAVGGARRLLARQRCYSQLKSKQAGEQGRPRSKKASAVLHLLAREGLVLICCRINSRDLFQESTAEVLMYQLAAAGRAGDDVDGRLGVHVGLVGLVLVRRPVAL